MVSRSSESRMQLSFEEAFEMRAALLYLVDEERKQKPEWREMCGSMSCVIYVEHGHLKLSHPFYSARNKPSVILQRNVRMAEPRSLVFRTRGLGKKGPDRIALRCKTKDLCYKFCGWAHLHDIKVSRRSRSKQVDSLMGSRGRGHRSVSGDHISLSHSRSETRASHTPSNRRGHSQASSISHQSMSQASYSGRNLSSGSNSGSNSRNLSLSRKSRSSNSSMSHPAAVVTADPNQLPVALVVVPAKSNDTLMRDAGYNTMHVKLTSGLRSLKNQIVLCNVTYMDTVQALLFVGSGDDYQAEVLMFDSDVNSGYEIDAFENFGLEPICSLGEMPRLRERKSKDAVATMRAVVKEAISEAMYKEIGRILEGTLGVPSARGSQRSMDSLDLRHYDL